MNNNFNIQQFAMQMLQRRMPANSRNNPMANNLIQIIQNGDQKSGEQMARNICQSMGVSIEDATQMARKFFSL